MKLLIIDLDTQKGHINLNRKILSILDKKFEVTLVSSESQIKKLNFANSISIKDSLFISNSKYDFVIKQIRIIIYIFLKYISNKYDKIIILGFENISFSLAWHLIKKPTFTYVHNNLTRGKMSLWFFKMIPNNVTHIVFENYITESLQAIVHNRIFSIPHPINPNISELYSNVLSQNNTIFCPSGSSDSDEVIKFAEYISNQDEYLFISKGKKDIRMQNVVIKPFFSNYEELLVKSKYIFIPFKYDNRVSGVFFDAMALGKIIICSENSGKFMLEMNKLYPNSVIILNSYSDISSLKIDENMHRKEVENFRINHSDENLEIVLYKIISNE